MSKQQIAPSPDFDTTSEQFGEAGGHDPDDLIRARQAADKLSAELGERLELSWFLMTKWLQQLTLSHRARARRALRWRPRFLAALAASCSFVLAARAAGISYNTFLLHQRNDPEFARQVAEAEEEAVDLLQARCFKVALEGQLELIYFQGKVVGHTRKFDSRLAIELLRAHKPNIFRTPGSKEGEHQHGQSALGGQQSDLRLAGDEAGDADARGSVGSHCREEAETG
jgi:hypothetical protein